MNTWFFNSQYLTKVALWLGFVTPCYFYHRTNCLGKKETYQLCSDSTDYCGAKILQTSQDYADKVCQKYRNKYPTLLSGMGRQLLPRAGNKLLLMLKLI